MGDESSLVAIGCDAFTLARIAGHSSITITQRYIHPQADAIERAFAPLALPSGTESTEEQESRVQSMKKGKNRMHWKLLVRKGGLEPPRFYPPDPKFPSNEESII